MNRWEVWLANVAFEDKPNQCKQRPVVVFDDKKMYCLAFKMTSHKPRNKEEYVVRNLKYAGLDKPTVIRTSKLLQLLPNDFVRYLGKLSHNDILGFIEKYKRENNK